MKKTLLYIMLAVVALTSCKTQDNLGYFKDVHSESMGVIKSSDTPIRLMPEDELKITVSSQSPAATAIYNLPLNASSLGTDTQVTTAQQFITYIVDRDGNIDFPVLGPIHVEGMTTLELKRYLVEKISETVKDPQVTVSLVNFKVKVLGEVKEPQIVEVKTERFTVLDALAAAGDLTEYAKRQDVVVIRQNEDGNLGYGIINLQDSKMAESPYFILQQNDVVYAYPNEVKEGQSRYNQNNGFKLQVISAIISGVSVMASLIIALTR